MSAGKQKKILYTYEKLNHVSTNLNGKHFVAFNGVIISDFGDEDAAIFEARSAMNCAVWKSTLIMNPKQEWFTNSLQLNHDFPCSSLQENVAPSQIDPLQEFLDRYN